jgi:hypothetical protein
MGDYLTDPVLLIKTAWGGKSLFVDFRPPSSGGQVGPCIQKGAGRRDQTNQECLVHQNNRLCSVCGTFAEYRSRTSLVRQCGELLSHWRCTRGRDEEAVEVVDFRSPMPMRILKRHEESRDLRDAVKAEDVKRRLYEAETFIKEHQDAARRTAPQKSAQSNSIHETPTAAARAIKIKRQTRNVETKIFIGEAVGNGVP